MTSEMDLAISLYVSGIQPNSDLISKLTIGVTSLGDVVTLVIISIVLSINQKTGTHSPNHYFVDCHTFDLYQTNCGQGQP